MLKKLKSLFVVEEAGNIENDTSAKSSEKSSSKPSPSSSTSAASPVLSDMEPPKDLSGKPDPKFLDILLKSIEKNNMEGFDYLEYKQALQNLKGVDMDEATRYKSAYAMAKTMGAEPKNLLESATFYQTILEQEQSKFLDALAKQKTQQIKGREQSLKSIETSIAEKEAKIEQLKQEIAASQEKLAKIKNEINESAAKVESTNQRFHVALKVVKSQIDDDIQKMKQYL